MSKQAVQVRVDEEMLAYLNRRAAETERTVSQYLRWLVRQDIEAHADQKDDR